MSRCFTHEDAASWATDFRVRAARDRVPVSAMLELTSRCNLRCQHCYLGDPTEPDAGCDPEMDTESVFNSLDEWAEAGCLYLVLTGGDPMMRPDFNEIYRHAAELGMLITVFCNGTLVTDELIELFRELPPRSIEVGVYGATAETYETVTQIPGSFSKAWKGIHRLHENGFRLTLKTMILTLNQHEVEAMAAQAEALDCKFRFDAAVFPCLSDGSKEPLSLRVDPETVVKFDTESPERLKKWAENIERGCARPESDRVYTCGAGLTSFYADPQGSLSPCLMAKKKYSYSTQGRRFTDIWQTKVSEVRDRQKSRRNGILYGFLQGACTHCPAMNYIETGDEEVESEYMRKTAQLRYETVMKTKKTEKVL